MILKSVIKFLRKEFKQIIFIDLNLIDIPSSFFLEWEKKEEEEQDIKQWWSVTMP